MDRFSPSTEECVRRFKRARNQQDKEESFRILFERYYPKVRRFFLRKGMSLETANDLTQETFFSVHKGLEGLRDEALFESWLFTIAQNVFRRKFEMENAGKRKGEFEYIDAEPARAEASSSPSRQIVDSRPTPIEEAIDQERSRMLREALSQLPEQMRRCMELRLVHDLSYQQIAAVLGINVNTVKAHLHQAKKSLKRKIGAYFNDADF